MIEDFEDWITLGIEKGWCGPPVCYTHDSVPTTDDEDTAFEEGNDPCLHVVRMYSDAEQKAAVETNHPPSVWRNRYRAVLATPEDEADIAARYGKTTDELADEAVKGYDIGCTCSIGGPFKEMCPVHYDDSL